MNKITTAWNRYLDWLARERVYVFQAPLGGDPSSLAAIPTRRSEELGLSGGTTKVQAECTDVEQSADVTEFEPPRNAA